VTDTVPDPEGDTAVHEMADVHVTDVAAVVPNITVAPDTKLAPVSVTVVPPAVVPDVGEIEDRVGTLEVVV
jgi:hypothetical protein